MSPTYDLETEQELANTYLRRWRDLLHLGDWWLSCEVQRRPDFASEKEDIYILMNEMNRVAKIYILAEPDRAVSEAHNKWEDNLELSILHELSHTLLFDLSPDTFKDEATKEREEKVVNKISMLFYGLYHQIDPTQEVGNGRRSCSKEEERKTTKGEASYTSIRDC